MIKTLLRLKNRISLYFPLLIILVAVLTIAVGNYKPGTFLVGWDNLHPEFDFGINIKRSIFAVWQEYQGVGLLGGMGHASDLIHQLFLFLASQIIPQNLLRYFWTMLALFIGGIGAYKFTQKLLPEKKGLALLGGLFYIFNLSTLQTFYIPFETFTNHFAALPWILWSTLNFLEKPKRKNLLTFALISLLATPSYYVPTLFLITLFGLGILSVVFFLFNFRWNYLLALARLYIVVFVTNAFWLLPFLYFTFTNGDVVPTAKINQMFSQNVFLENKNFGTFPNVALLRGFWFGRTDLNIEGNNEYLMGSIEDYAFSFTFQLVGYSLFFVILLGLVISLRSRKPSLTATASLFVFGFTMLATNTPPFAELVQLFRHRLPLFDEAFRFPFTKFSIFTSLTYASLFTLGAYFLSKLFKSKSANVAICILGVLILLIYLSPFYNHLFYKREQLEIPKEYFQTFEFFKNQDPNTRIANFPQQGIWSWNYYRWGYEGSGFLWYGIKQPILDRAFDPWSNYNENYYWEVSHALYSKNPELLNKVLEKYQVNWILIDQNTYSTTSQKPLYFDQIQSLLLQIPKITLSKKYGNIEIYKVKLETPVNNFVFSTSKLPEVGPTYKWTDHDLAYSQIGTYKVGTGEFLYPFRSLFTKRDLNNNPAYTIQESENSYILQPDISLTNSQLLDVPQDSKELPLANITDLREISYQQANIITEENSFKVEFPKVGGYFSAEISPDTSDAKIYCQDIENQKGASIQEENGKKYLNLKSKGSNCNFSIWLPTLQHSFSYIISVENKNIHGQPPVFWIENPISKKADIETYLPVNKNLTTNYLIQPPMETDGVGYALHIDNRSAGNDLTENRLGAIKVYTFPYRYLSQIRFTKNPPILSEAKPVSEVKHPNEAFYTVKPSDSNEQTLVLSQAFNPGWHAYSTNAPALFAPILGKSVKHILVNNWENGWEIENSQNQRIVLVYLPQYLEFLGFATLGIGTILFLAIWYNKHTRRTLPR